VPTAPTPSGATSSPLEIVEPNQRKSTRKWQIVSFFADKESEKIGKDRKNWKKSEKIGKNRKKSEKMAINQILEF